MKNTYPAVKIARKHSDKDLNNTIKNYSHYPSSENDDFFNLMTENSRDIVFRAHFSPAFAYDYVSQSSTRITGYTPEDFFADPFLAKKCILPEDLHLLKDPHQPGAPLTYEPTILRWRCKDGRIIWTEHIVTINRNKRGEPETCQIIARDITERKNTEEALQESQKFVSSLLENAPHATVVLNPDTSVRYVNPAWERLNGWTLTEVIGIKAPYPWWPEEFKEVFLGGFQEAMKQSSGKGEVIAVKKNGEYYWIDMNWVQVTHNGELQYLVINSLDITERKKVEQALKESEEKFSVAFRSSPQMLIITDVENNKYLEINDSFVNVIGYSREEMMSHNVDDFQKMWVKPEELEKMTSLLQTQGKVRDEEFTFRTKSGEIRQWLCSADMVTIGGKQCMLAVAIDITDRKKAQEALRESEEKFSRAFHSSPDIMAITTLKDGRYIEVNESFTRVTGFTREEAIGRKATDINTWVNPEDRTKYLNSMNEHGRVYNDEFQFRIRSGEVHTMLFSAEPINIGGEQCVISVSNDITERKKVEKALRESEEKFSAAFHSSPDMMIITNLNDGNYTEVNESFAHVLGYSREELIGHRADEFNLWADPQDADKMTRLMQEQGKIKHEEYRFLTKSGEIRTWLCSADILTIGGEPSMLAVATDITESKKIQEALLESEEKFSKAFQASPGSISISRLKDFKFIEVNDSFLRDRGYTREEIIGHNPREFHFCVDPDFGHGLLKTLQEGGKVHNEVVQFRTKSGFIRTGLMSADIINIGNEPCMLVLNNDITQQKQAEEQLRLLSSVTQQVSDSIIISDPNFRITYMNRAAQDLFGYTIDEIRGKQLEIFDKTPPTDKSKQEIIEAVIKGKVLSRTIPKKRKDGSTIICDCRLSPLYDEKGQISSYIDVQRDVTQQKEVEAKLQAQKQLIEKILATMPEGVLVIDGDDRVILANESVHQIFHRTSKTLINKSLKDIIPVNQLLALYNGVKSGKKEDNTLEFRHRVRGIETIIICVAIKMDGERTLLTFTDVSREREEEEKLYLTDRLASIGEMAAGLAHELNNPLTGILSLSQLLIESDIPEEPKEDLQCINSEAKRAAGIVKNVLLFTRNNNYENGQASVNEVVKDVLRLREYEEKASNIKIVTNLQDNLPEVIIDKFQLQQVFLNIILNAEAAIKDANRPGLLTVTTERVNHHVNIMFSDNGCGIKKNILPRIFDPFFTTKDIGKGTGLGLSICYGIVSKHDGKISVRTQVNKGTTFTVRMPVVS